MVDDAGANGAAEACRMVLVSCPDADAERLARALVEGRLAACVNVLSGMRSVYLWKGRVETAVESLLLIKTTVSAWPALERTVRTLHPYELPELLVFHPSTGLPGYLEWVCECVSAD